MKTIRPLEKRHVSILIPFRFTDGQAFVYMQKRSAEMVNPGNYAFWGGGWEAGESAEQALVREIREELGFELDEAQVSFFGRYEFFRGVMHVYALEVTTGWEDGIIIGEGESGRWFSLEEAIKEERMSFRDKAILNDFTKYAIPELS